VDSIAGRTGAPERLRDRADLVIDTGELNTQPAADPPARWWFGAEEEGSHHADLWWSPRLQARGAPRRRPDVSTAGSCPIRTGTSRCGPTAASSPRWRATCSTDPRLWLSSTSSTTCSPCYPRLHEGGEVLPDLPWAVPAAATARVVAGRGTVPGLDAHGCPPPSSHRDVDRLTAEPAVAGPRVVAIGGGHGLPDHPAGGAHLTPIGFTANRLGGRRRGVVRTPPPAAPHHPAR